MAIGLEAGRRGSGGLGLAVGLILGLCGAAAAEPAAAPLAVAPARAEAGARSVARGFDFWLERTLWLAGRETRALADAGATDPPGEALLARLRERDGRLEVALTLVEPASGRVLAAGVGQELLAQPGPACTAALAGVAPALGIPADTATPPLLGELSSTTRALDHREQGRLLAAWRALQGKLTPTATALREELVAAARRPGSEPSERARVLAAHGDLVAAWALVGSRAKRELGNPAPDVAVLVAAAEIQLARENPRDAMRYLDVARTHRPDDADVLIATARARLLQNDPQAARVALVRAAERAPADDRAHRLLIELDAGQPRRAASHQLAAGVRAARQLEPSRARLHLEQAMALDPALTASAGQALGDLEGRLGQPAAALSAYRRAAQAAPQAPEPLLGMGRSQRALGNDAAAERSLRHALELEPHHAPAVAELGVLLADGDRPDEAVELLRTARELEPENATTQLALARALRLVGTHGDAVEVLMSGGTLEDAAVLRELARNHAASGDHAAAEASLLHAVDLEPYDPALREELAQTLEERGDAAAAAGERELAGLLVAGQARPADPAERQDAVVLAGFGDLVATFAAQVPAAGDQSTVHLGVREPDDWRTWLRRLVRPRGPDHAAIEAGLREAVAARFAPGDAPATDTEALGTYIDQLYAFESDASRSAEVIAGVNGVLATDGVFVTRLLAHPEDHAVGCAAGTLGLETRLLRGREPSEVRILAHVDCVAGGLQAYGRWNHTALVLYGLLAVFVVFPVLRGWGTVVVRIRLPQKTKGFFSIHLTKGSGRVKREVVDKKTGKAKIRSGGRLDFLRRFERHMAGRETALRWIPARKGEYTVTVGGPLLDSRGQEIIGHFLEEQRARVRRRGRTELDFDFRPKECAVEVTVRATGQPAPEARVAVEGDPSSLRYAREGVAYLYLGKGEYTILVGSKDAVAAFRIQIERLDAAVPLCVDIDDCEALFRGCGPAVEFYLIGDLASAADALEAAGDHDAAHRLRAEVLEDQGLAGDAALELEAAGDLGHAAELRAADADHSRSAALYEQAGDPAHAAAAHREAGAWADAARCYEEIYDYGNALECWREAGDEEHELDILEKLGEYTAAAEIAHARGDLDRAIRNLQQIDARHPEYGHTCRLIAEIVSERGDHELAVAKFDEALAPVGVENASLDVLESYAGILERAGMADRAISTYEVIQRRDVGRTDLTTRIQELRSNLEPPAGTGAAAGAPAGEARYELLDEIGRGGMGVVYRARDRRLGRIVALKRLPENLRDHPTAVELFDREARAAAALNHVNIVTLFDAGEEDGAYFITMELLEGRALNEILARNGRISARDTARLGIQIAAGLQYAHERQIVHRDIKTANLFFTNEQVVKVMDFGIAKSLEEVRRSTTVVGGTPYYMAPEQAKGQGVDHRADLYAFGVTLFQLATGSLPFSDGDVSYRHAHEAPPDPREIEVSVPAGLAALILHLMGKRPEDRPDSAAEVGEGLRALVV